jgi:hypothetical protein
MNTISRTAYLPLISPALTEEDKTFDFSSQRRGSTPSLAKSSASQYFEELRKRRRTSETAATAATSNQPVSMHERESQSTGKFAELPSSIAQSILRALESQAKASTSVLESTTLKKRTMSMPSARPDEDLEMGRDDKKQRRASMRSQQLALLASQARLARTGSTSVHTALLAERAVEGAVRQVVKEAQAGNLNKDLSDFAAAEQGSDSDEISPTDVGEKPTSSVAEMQVSAAAWSDALSTPHTATAFLSSASAVAHDWANGFYRFEEEWAEDALKKEKRRMSEHHVGGKRPRREELLNELAAEFEDGLASPKKVSSAPSTREVSPIASDVTPTPDTNAVAPMSVRSSLVAAHKRLSASLPAIPTTSSSTPSEGGGQLVDVLSNFASLIGQRKEVCHGLEKLAHNAKSLSNVKLPSIASALSHQSRIEEEDADEDDYNNGDVVK